MARKPKSLGVVAASWAFCMVLAWLPYTALLLYWRSLLDNVPGAAHGELSGPVLYFLPRLQLLGIVASLIITCVSGAVAYHLAADS